jgi:hypothetical protein
MQKLLRGSLLLVVLSLVSLISPSISPVIRAEAQDLHGYSGDITLIPNAAIKQITLVLKSPILLTEGSNQIVFVLQTSEQSYPSSWSGAGRVLVGDGVVIFSPGGNANNHAWAFKFSEKPIPSSVKDWQLETYKVFGIARYGEKAPLTTEQISNLANTGYLTGLKTL